MLPVLLVGAALACLALSVVLGRRTAGPARAQGRSTVAPAAGPAGAAPTGGGLVGFLARHPWARRGLAVSAVLMVVGALAAATFPFLTDRYTETLQTRLEEQLVSGATRTAYETDTVEVGDSLTRIRIPAIGLDTVVVEGATTSALRAGAGHYPETPLPCEGGNVAIAGHRTTYGKPFADLEKLEAGDEIFLDTPIGGCTYEVAAAAYQVDPDDVWVTDPTPDPVLTLTTCHPEGSARHRLVLHAKRMATHQEPAT